MKFFPLPTACPVFDEIPISRFIYVHNYHVSITLPRCAALLRINASPAAILWKQYAIALPKQWTLEATQSGSDGVIAKQRKTRTQGFGASAIAVHSWLPLQH